ncbi:kinase phosphorylation protein-domain-containing protein [Phlebopus sp. FC_14]|nr:kinase phosphorylation protein-domain-containing protein [Phlebopus sp. FC_14]
MFEPIRGGTRGGQAEFKWSDVSADKDREHYLGHSINAPTGRWQKNKDVHWYNRDQASTQAERDEEIRKIKEAEAEALSVALQVFLLFQPVASTSAGSPANQATAVNDEDAKRKADKEGKRRQKAERKEEKRARKEVRRAARAERDNGRRSRSRHRSRSRSPRRRNNGGEDRYARRSRSPVGYRREKRSSRLDDYDEIERENERERDRRKWDMNATRHGPSARYRDD